MEKKEYENDKDEKCLEDEKCNEINFKMRTCMNI